MVSKEIQVVHLHLQGQDLLLMQNLTRDLKGKIFALVAF
jgi:hypothetical protein